MIKPLYKLSSAILVELSDLINSDAPTQINLHSVQQVVGISHSSATTESLNDLLSCGWTSEQVSLLLKSIANARLDMYAPEQLFDLVLSGPEVAQIPTRDTAAVIHSICEEAKKEILLVGYAIYKGHVIFKRIAEKMAANPNLKVRFLLNIERKWRDTSLDSEIVMRFANDFCTNHWPWTPRPEVFYDPRSLSLEAAQRASLHAKSVIVDRRVALITSANFTEAAQYRNIEAGLVIRHEPMVTRLCSYFLGLCDSVLAKCPLELNPSEGEND